MCDGGAAKMRPCPPFTPTNPGEILVQVHAAWLQKSVNDSVDIMLFGKKELFP